MSNEELSQNLTEKYIEALDNQSFSKAEIFGYLKNISEEIEHIYKQTSNKEIKVSCTIIQNPLLEKISELLDTI